MSKYVVAFITQGKRVQLRHAIVEGENRDAALRSFFTDGANGVNENYSNDEHGFLYFKEDFFDEHNPAGSIIELE